MDRRIGKDIKSLRNYYKHQLDKEFLITENFASTGERIYRVHKLKVELEKETLMLIDEKDVLINDIMCVSRGFLISSICDNISIKENIVNIKFKSGYIKIEMVE